MNDLNLVDIIYYIYIINFFVLFAVQYITKHILDFFFLCDKSKSFKRQFKKAHNFLYRNFFFNVFNKKYMNSSKCRNHVIVFYIFYVMIIIYGLFLVVSGKWFLLESYSTCVYKYLEIIYLVITSFYLLWYLLNCKGKGYHWWLPATWWKGSFQIDISNLKKTDN